MSSLSCALEYCHGGGSVLVFPCEAVWFTGGKRVLKVNLEIKLFVYDFFFNLARKVVLAVVNVNCKYSFITVNVMSLICICISPGVIGFHPP